MLASKFGEGLAKDAGSSTWDGVKRVHELISRRFVGHATSTAALAALGEEPTAAAQSVVAESIDSLARVDRVFADQLKLLIAEADGLHETGRFVAIAREDARQVNIQGGNTGTINMA
ncbi:hypothetical protein EBN03_29905 [Nocardia stercoris]|uniref:Uncharacterized protein n=1 Tax=Nocardia stercoris TaxID=2483361 RepID=A0A3M2KS21_9NOCA|nr:hypothetical protein EBN03_29905 [Nocardia stercoris]